MSHPVFAVNTDTWNGWVQQATDNVQTVIATFTSDSTGSGTVYVFVLKLDQVVPKFSSSAATLDLNNTGQLVSDHQVNTGTVGKTTFTFTLDNGPVISGTLDNAISSTTQVTGNGTWISK